MKKGFGVEDITTKKPIGINTLFNVGSISKTFVAFGILQLAKEYKIDFDRELINEVKDGAPEVRLFLQEKGEYLVFQPIFSYKGFENRTPDKAAG